LRRQSTILNKIDWPVVIIYFVLVLMGWLNIYAAIYDDEASRSIFDITTNSGKQLIWIFVSVLIIIVILTLDFRLYDSVAAYLVYALIVLMLVFVLFFGREVAGSTSWFSIGGFRLQPSEFAKFATALAVARYMGKVGYKIGKLGDLFMTLALVVTPALLIILQGDTGTALVFGAFVIVLYREGFNPIVIAIGLIAIGLFVLTLIFERTYLTYAVMAAAVVSISIVLIWAKKKLNKVLVIIVGALVVLLVVWSVDYFVSNALRPHQQDRIKALIDPGQDPTGFGWNVTQSKIAIGSGGLLGKGYLQGTQTKFNFVPEQSTDFIFCTLGEEHGWIGTTVVILLFLIMLLRLLAIAERQKEAFARIYGYSVASIIFIHFMVNIGMTIGLFPVIGIPLPLISYGGSSLLGFTVLIFILIKIDAHRMQLLDR
jgi:rod shape determining protein RodA